MVAEFIDSHSGSSSALILELLHQQWIKKDLADLRANVQWVQEDHNDFDGA